MKVKRLLTLMLILTLLGVTAASANTEYKVYTAKKVDVTVNGSALETGLSVDINKNSIGTNMVSLDEIVNALGGIVSSNESNGIQVYKPNVQMSAVSPKELKAIQVVEKGKNDIKVPIKVFAFMDSIKTNISFIKITVVDPFGEEIESIIEPLAKSDQSSEVFQYTS